MAAYMRKVDIPGKSSDELYDKISHDLGKFLEKAQIGKCDVSNDKNNKTISAKGSMFSADISCGEGFVSLNVKLSLLASAFRGKIDESIDRWLEKTFGTKG